MLEKFNQLFKFNTVEIMEHRDFGFKFTFLCGFAQIFDNGLRVYFFLNINGDSRNCEVGFIELPPIKESISGVNLDRLWATLGRHINGEEAIYGGADNRLFASG